MSVFVERVGQGPDVVLLHGWGMSHVAWHAVVPLLAAHYTLHLVDLPGFGHSDPVSDHSLQTLTKQVGDDVPQQASWIGWSMGGLVAQMMAHLEPSRVQRLLLVASTPFFPEQTDWPGIKPAVLAQFASQLAQDYRKTLQRFMAIQAMGEPDTAHRVKALRQMMEQQPLPDKTALHDGLMWLQNVDLRAEFATLACPVRALFGRLDTLVPKRAARNMVAINANVQTATLAKASHAPFMTDPQWFTEQVLDFCPL